MSTRDGAQRDEQLLLSLTGNEKFDGLTLLANDMTYDSHFLWA